MDQTTPGENTGHKFDHLKEWPNCPPSSSVAREGTFYAFHDSDPPNEDDFQTAAQRLKYEGKDECQRRSNSIFSDLNAIKKVVARLRRTQPLRYQFISAGDITKDCGLIDPGDGPHHSFWVSATTSMHAIFTRRVS